MSEATQVLAQIEEGNGQAAAKLLPLVYDELRRLAAQKMAQELPGQTLQATALVHEAYIRLVDVDTVQHWNSRGHFFAAAAEAMRRILVERARERGTDRSGGKHHRVEFHSNLVDKHCPRKLLELNDALGQLERHDEVAAKLVKLRYFAGFTQREAAEVLGISRRTADRLWTLARTWLYRQVAHT
jgi:RNA polymerase sigma factor (TIGR02999 family)